MRPDLKNMKTPVPILIAEFSPLATELISGALKRGQNYFEVVGYALTSTEAVQRLGELEPSVALISIDLQDGPDTGLRVIRHIRENQLKTAAVALVRGSNATHVVEAFQNGARGVISRDQPFRTLARCLRKVHQGEIWTDCEHFEFVVRHLSNTKPKEEPAPHKLTQRELEVAHLIAAGMANADIAGQMGVSEHTVRNYVLRIYDKVGVSNRVQLTHYWLGLQSRSGAPDKLNRADLSASASPSK
jgi:DNA-binding NarL/FixJ family response regulator